jgi:WD40 repeat protein
MNKFFCPTHFIVFSVLFLFSCTTTKPVKLSPEVLIQKGHTGMINSISPAQNQDLFLTTSRDNSFKIWDKDLRLIKSVAVGFAIKRAEFFDQDQKIFVVGNYGKWRTYDFDGNIIQDFPGSIKFGVLCSAAISPDGRSVLTSDYRAGLYLVTGDKFQIINKPTSGENKVSTAIFAIDGKSFFAFHRGLKSVQRFDLEGKLLSEKKVPNRISKMLRHKSGKIIMMGYQQRYYRDKRKNPQLTSLIWNHEKQTYHKFSSKSLSRAYFNSDSSKIIMLEAGTSNILIADENGKVISKFKAKNKYYKPIQMVVSSENTIITIGNFVMSLWDFKGNLIKVKEEDLGIKAISIDRKNHNVAAVYNKNIRILNFEKRLSRILSSNQAQYSVSFSPDGKLIASGGKNLHIWDSLAGQLEYKLAGHKYNINGISFSSDGKLIFTSGGDGYLNRYSLNSKNKFRLDKRLKVSKYRGESVAVHPFKKIVSIANGNLAKKGKVKTYDFEGNKLWEFKAGYPISISFSPNGKYLAILRAYNDENIVILNSLNGEIINKLSGVRNINVGKIKFSPSGNYLVSSVGNIALIWKVNGWKVIRILKKHTDDLRSFDFLYNKDDTLITGSSDATIGVWNLNNNNSARMLFSDKKWIIYNKNGYFYTGNGDSEDLSENFKKTLCSEKSENLSYFNRPDIIFGKLDVISKEQILRLKDLYKNTPDYSLIFSKTRKEIDNSCLNLKI